MKRSEVRALADEAYAILDDADAEADVAITRAMEVLKNAPTEAESFLLLSEVFEEKGRFDQALIWADQGLSNHPAHEALLLKKASLLLDGFDDLDEAFLLLKSIRDSFGTKSLTLLKEQFDEELLADVFLLLTDCYRLKGDFNQAYSHAEIALELCPKDEAAILAMATAHFELGNYAQALDNLKVEHAREPSDYFWLLGQIHCAMGSFEEADQAFIEANKIDRTRYHRPIRVTQSVFFNCFEQATLALPKEIRDFLLKSAIEVKDVIPLEIIQASKGTLSPLACIFLNKKSERDFVIYLFQKNLENLAHKKSEIRDLIASALLHELGKVVGQVL